MAEAGAGDATDFARRMLRTMNEAALALMVSVGHRTRLFDVMADMPLATSAEIAARAALDERYVREWLAVMTTARRTRRSWRASPRRTGNVPPAENDAYRLGQVQDLCQFRISQHGLRVGQARLEGGEPVAFGQPARPDRRAAVGCGAGRRGRR